MSETNFESNLSKYYHKSNDCILKINRLLTQYCDWTILSQLDGYLEQNLYIIVQNIHKHKLKIPLCLFADEMRISKKMNYMKKGLFENAEVFEKNKDKNITNEDVIKDMKIAFNVFTKVGSKHLHFDDFNFDFNENELIVITHKIFSKIPNKEEFKKEAKIYKEANKIITGHALEHVAKVYGFKDYNTYNAYIKNHDTIVNSSNENHGDES